MSTLDFIGLARERVQRYVDQELATLRKNRAATWPEYTQFMWRTEEGWQAWLKAEGQDVIQQLTHDAWHECFCAAFEQLVTRIEDLEQQVAALKTKDT